MDHPRSRGVYDCIAYDAVYDLGSSPLARGLLEGRLASLHTQRIIPARAGLTTPPWG